MSKLSENASSVPDEVDTTNAERESALRNAELNRAVELAISKVGTPEGSQKLAAYLATLPFPHFEEDTESPKVLVQIDVDGMRTRVHCVNHQLVPV
ncbi:MAG: hypothetical protein LBV28_02190 [Puniceicoccales bacterium]|jgi:hypothetical protein|nr:hypothetical protein [Puniceicoccales bacterium]